MILVRESSVKNKEHILLTLNPAFRSKLFHRTSAGYSLVKRRKQPGTVWQWFSACIQNSFYGPANSRGKHLFILCGNDHGKFLRCISNVKCLGGQPIWFKKKIIKVSLGKFLCILLKKKANKILNSQINLLKSKSNHKV